jgi:hypothetical protein
MGKTSGDESRAKLQTKSVKPEVFPKLAELHKSHFGLVKEVAQCFAQAADVCFDRHHRSPHDLAIKSEKHSMIRQHRWRKPSERAKASWANKDDATRDGAYAVCIASLEVAEGLYAIGRAETRTGADYYLDKKKAAKDLERAYRLEVSGTDGSEADATTRFRIKKNQTSEGESVVPAFAAVVSFKDAIVLYGKGTT